MATIKADHLSCVLKSHQIRKKKVLLDKFIARRDEISEAMTEKYKSTIYDLFNSGSYAKNTAVNTKFDFDLMAPFKRNAFNTLEKMFNDVFSFLNEKFGGVASVRKQKVSIGIEFYPDDDGDIVKIDVVPGRELNQDQYKDDHKLNLYVFSQFGKLIAGTEKLQSNIHAQIKNIRDNAESDFLREIIRLLKVWKINKGQNCPYKSFFIELIVIKVFEKEDVSGDLWERLKKVIEFISENVKSISLPDPGNSNNDISDSLSDIEKQLLSNDMKLMLDNIESNSDNIKLYFPVNNEFPCEKTKTYGNGERSFSVPPPTRFGKYEN